MIASVSVPGIGWNRQENLAKMLSHMDAAASQNADLLLFPETVLTGLINTGDTTNDMGLGITIDSNEILSLSLKAAETGLWVAFGFFELENNVLFDSAMLLDSCGGIALHYRRISTG